MKILAVVAVVAVVWLLAALLVQGAQRQDQRFTIDTYQEEVYGPDTDPCLDPEDLIGCP